MNYSMAFLLRQVKAYFIEFLGGLLRLRLLRMHLRAGGYLLLRQNVVCCLSLPLPGPLLRCFLLPLYDFLDQVLCLLRRPKADMRLQNLNVG